MVQATGSALADPTPRAPHPPRPQLSVPQTLAVSLAGNPTTGYEWTAAASSSFAPLLEV